MKRVNRNPDSEPGKQSDPNEQSAMNEPGRKYPPSDSAPESSRPKVVEVEEEKEGLSNSARVAQGKLLGGLLANGFNEETCISRYQSVSYRKELPHKPSSYLISSLRNYEALHKKCGPHTESYKMAVEQLKSGNNPESSDCSYLVWISFSGLGNRILTLASAFLYALVTNRVLLIDPGVDMADLFCEPFPDVFWFLPLDFPLKAKADEKIGIQIRIFGSGTSPFEYVLDQILNCTVRENILPEFNRQEQDPSQYGTQKSKALLVTSLSSWYSQKMRNMYWEHPSMTGELIGIYQPSHEEYQQTEKQNHNRKAWAEMYLLSLTDVLVTSSWSTFGYVAQGLGGLKPWILYKPENQSAPDPPCRRAMSAEPCFHAPPFYDCKARKGIDTGALVPHVRHCEDMSWGLKLVDV
ncbi:hypothetical protein JCGZ_11653 [Jatropha curcas]|uniref:Fucosyltransferase n=1 Tax=Jatropha curcas TaxID=180498 RepID=A0A067K598_JATCU|nr:hypothetical protein JCGZ_11653 [Jatropha curcas]